MRACPDVYKRQVMMLTATLVIYLQVRHLVNAPLGFNYENVFMVAANNTQAMREELDKMPFVQRVGCFEGTSLTGNNTNMITIHRPDNDATQDVSFYTLNMDSVALGIYGLDVYKRQWLGSTSTITRTP